MFNYIIIVSSKLYLNYFKFSLGMGCLILSFFDYLCKYDKTQNHNDAVHFLKQDGFWILSYLIKEV